MSLPANISLGCIAKTRTSGASYCFFSFIAFIVCLFVDNYQFRRFKFLQQNYKKKKRNVKITILFTCQQLLLTLWTLKKEPFYLKIWPILLCKRSHITLQKESYLKSKSKLMLIKCRANKLLQPICRPNTRERQRERVYRILRFRKH